MSVLFLFFTTEVTQLAILERSKKDTGSGCQSQENEHRLPTLWAVGGNLPRSRAAVLSSPAPEDARPCKLTPGFRLWGCCLGRQSCGRGSRAPVCLSSPCQAGCRHHLSGKAPDSLLGVVTVAEAWEWDESSPLC